MLSKIALGIAVLALIVSGVSLVGGDDQPALGGLSRLPNSDLSARTITSDGAFTSTGAATFSSTITGSGDLTIDTSDLFVDVSGDVVSIGSSTPDTTVNGVLYSTNGTSTLYISSGIGGSTGGCIQMEGWDTSEATTTYKIFVAADGTLTTETGHCTD